jgi:hypothetical protein
MRDLAADLRKLIRLSSLGVALGWILCVSALVSLHLASADSQYEIATTSYNEVAHPESQKVLCDFLAQPIGPRCDAAREEELGFDSRFLEETRELYPLASAAMDPIGSGGVVAGFMASLIGALIVAGIGGAHVGGEWGHGTVKQMLAGDPRRLRFFFVKIASVWIAGIALLLAGWLTIALASVLFDRWYDVPPAPSGFDFVSFTEEQVARATLVIGVVAVLTTCVAVFVRSAIGTLGATAAVLVATLVATASASAFRLSPAYWVAAWMRYRPVTLWQDHLWVDRFPLVNPDPTLAPDQWTGLVSLVGFLILVGAIGAVRLVRSDV